MTSTLQDIADTMATEFRDAVKDAEKADVDTIESIMQAMDSAFHEYSTREHILNTKAEEASRTLQEIYDLRDVNYTTYQRRITALREQLEMFKGTKIAAKPEPSSLNVVKLVENK